MTKKFTKVTALQQLIQNKSKHSQYQVLHPLLLKELNINYKTKGKFETEREQYMNKYKPVVGLHILDIGANTGYFSLAAVDSGALSVISMEGNKDHAEFIQISSSVLGIDKKLEVQNIYFNFEEPMEKIFDLTLCLNVLHHLGSDFSDKGMKLETAKDEMLKSLNSLAYYTRKCWIQIGFNWQGNRNKPLFSNGTKSELINFIENGTKNKWNILDIAVFNPETLCYETITDQTMKRFDEIGEFLNRPLFFMNSNMFCSQY